MKILFLAFLFSVPAYAYKAVSLKYSPSCIFAAVAKRMLITPNAAIPFPLIFMEKDTPLKQFQDAIEPQWGMRPDMFTNVYIEAKNEIYLIDEADYYEKMDRTVDDSLAHELAHYVQVHYQKVPLAEGGDAIEADAVDVQTWLRETYMETGKSPCGDSQ